MIAFALLFLMLLSCRQRMEVEPQIVSQVVDFEFSKSLSVADASGNRADFEFWTHDESLLAEFDASDFELIVTNQAFALQPTQEEPVGTGTAESWFTRANEVLIRLKDFQAIEGVTGISIRLKPEALDGLLLRNISVIDENDDNDITGGGAIYEVESCPDETVRLRVFEKKSDSNLFWELLGEEMLDAPNEQIVYTGSTSWAKLRLSIEHNGECPSKGRLLPVWIVR